MQVHVKVEAEVDVSIMNSSGTSNPRGRCIFGRSVDRPVVVLVFVPWEETEDRSSVKLRRRDPLNEDLKGLSDLSSWMAPPAIGPLVCDDPPVGMRGGRP